MSLQPDLENELREAVSRDDVEKFSELASPLKWGEPAWAACQLLLRDLGGDGRDCGCGLQVYLPTRIRTLEDMLLGYFIGSGRKIGIELNSGSKL